MSEFSQMKMCCCRQSDVLFGAGSAGGNESGGGRTPAWTDRAAGRPAAEVGRHHAATPAGTGRVRGEDRGAGGTDSQRLASLSSTLQRKIRCAFASYQGLHVFWMNSGPTFWNKRLLFLIPSNHPAGGQVTPTSDATKLPELQRTVDSLQEAAGQRETLVSELSAQLEEAQQKQVVLQQEKDEAQEENAALLQNYTRLQASVSELQARVQEQEERTVQKAQLEQEIQELKTNLAG